MKEYLKCMKEEEEMSLGGEIVMAVVGLWAVYLRPSLIRYAVEMLQVLRNAIIRFFRAMPSFSFSTYLPQLF